MEMKQRITLKEVAAQAGVSYQTVSKVLNHKVQVSPETESKIWEAAQALGYQPNQLARSLRSQRSCLIGYSWSPVPPEFHNPIIDQFVQSMLNAVEGTGYNLLCFRQPPGTAPLEAYRELVDTHRVDAFVLSDVEFNDPRVIFLSGRHFPFVAFGRTDQEWDIPYVDVDGAFGVRQVVRHLIERGHRRVGVLTWPEGSRVGEDRMEGYFTALHDAGIAPQREWILRGDGVFSFGYDSAMHWLDLPPAIRPTAVVAFNDYMAIGVKQALEERGLQVGVDMAVTGFDDTPLVKYLTPPLTSVRQPIWEVGQRIVSMIVDLLEERPLIYRHLIMQPEIIIRESSATAYGPGK
jgi:DNA-binding LacI/PurR family transcriptional regulator